jgi:transcriptional regulator with XRE-family HTH domain
MAYNKLKGRIVEMYGTQAKFAEALDVTETTLSRKMQSKSEFSKEDMIKWSKLLNIPQTDIPAYFFCGED